MADTLVVLDFPGRRAEARLSDLRLQDRGWHVLYPISEPFSRAVDPSEYVAHLARRCAGAEIRAVLAYCMAAPLARDLAVRLGGVDTPLPVVFFDGEPGTGTEVRDTVRVIVRQLTGGPADDLDGELTAALADAGLRDRPERAMELLADRMIRLGAEVFREDGLDQDEAVAAATRVSGFYLDWIAFLVASFRAGSPAPRAGSVTHVRSADQPVSDDWIDARSLDVHVVDCVRADLLADPRTRELAADLLGRPAPATSPGGPHILSSAVE
ncbi:hypothetical protein [Streptomyces fuscichromogenes]|uniref:Uncharacterized protein n=1 Tax=Streptomyces fuscichromogenes TaxID=1324013 RepID=A0A917XAE5_9ACTN|nr:hypothetical protein [Streptomyces fuscichromogenes]GGN01313.1 hypothetical protein GCM10011578_023300 [Streptomyces fuscichromogenes]